MERNAIYRSVILPENMQHCLEIRQLRGSNHVESEIQAVVEFKWGEWL